MKSSQTVFEERCCQEELVDGSSDKATRVSARELVTDRPFGWLTVIVAPLLMLAYLTHVGMPVHNALFIAIVSLTLLMWIFSLMSDFIPALLGVLLLTLFGVAPLDVVLSGFSSPGFLLAFSVMGLGAVVTGSGLTRRYSLFLMRKLPQNTFAHQMAVFFTGFLFTPIVPTITGRAVIVAPILNNIARGWDKQTRERSQSALYTSGLDGINFLSPVFLTAAPANFMIFGLLPPQEQQAFQFVFWAFAASLTGLVMLLLYVAVSSLYFRSFKRVVITKDEIREQSSRLGKMSYQEWVALAGIIFMAGGIATAEIHKIDIPVITFFVMCVLLVIGVLRREDFIKRIDWAFLFLLGGMIGLLATMNYLQVDKLLMAKLSWLDNYMRDDFQLFVLLLTIAILVVRLFIPLNSAILIFATALIPIANNVGVSPWLVGFIILIVAETAFFAYQSPYIMYFRTITQESVSPDERKLIVFHGMLVVVKVLAIFVSIPFWTSIGIL